jgi:hypothetical protein
VAQRLQNKCTVYEGQVTKLKGDVAKLIDHSRKVLEDRDRVAEILETRTVQLEGCSAKFHQLVKWCDENILGLPATE